MHITYLGTPNFSKRVLKTLVDKGITVNAVVTAEDKPKGRGMKKKPTPVKEWAVKNSIPVFHDLSATIDETDLVLVAAFGEIINRSDLNKPEYGFLNLHPSLLPKYRGPTPMQETILNDDEETGVTIILMDEKIDHGPILSQEKVDLNGDEYYKDLENELSILGGKLLAKTVNRWIKGDIKPEPQNHERATMTGLLTKEDGRVDWSESAVKIERKIRAYNPWPGVFSKTTNGKLLKFFKANTQKQTSSGPFGDLGKIYLGTNNKIAIQTGKNFLLVNELQLEGEKRMNSKAFLRKHEDIIGEVLN